MNAQSWLCYLLGSVSSQLEQQSHVTGGDAPEQSALIIAEFMPCTLHISSGIDPTNLLYSKSNSSEITINNIYV